jgi:anti-anti-sigma factor
MDACWAPRGVAFAVEDAPGARTLVVSGEIDLATAPEFEHFLGQQLHASGRPEVLDLDLSRVLFFSAIGLRVLLDATDAAGGLGVRLRVVAISSAVGHVLDLTHTRPRLEILAAPRTSGLPG